MTTLHLAVVAALAATPLAAQLAPPVVDPAAHTWFDTMRSTGFPFGYPDRQVVRYQEVHDGLAGRPRTITSIAFRRSRQDPAPAAAFVAVLSMRLSTANTTAATIDARFADNEGADVRDALPERSVSFPATGVPATGLAPFDFVVPADVPFVFSGAGPLCFELRVASHTNRTPITFALAAADPTLRTVPVADGCGGLQLTTTFADEIATHAVAGSAQGSPVVIAFGFDTDTLGGAPLPLDLTPLGAPGCAWAIDIAATSVGSADDSQLFSIDLDLGGAPPGTVYFCQALSPLGLLEPGSNLRSLIASGAHAVTLGHARVAGRTWIEDLSATAGQRQPVFGLVIEVR